MSERPATHSSPAALPWRARQTSSSPSAAHTSSVKVAICCSARAPGRGMSVSDSDGRAGPQALSAPRPPAPLPPAMTVFEEIGAAVGCLTALTRPEHARAVPRDERGGPRGDLAALGAADPLEVSGRSPAARADPHELLDNALKYTPAGGREEMSAQGEGREWVSTGGGVRKEAGSRRRGRGRMRLRSLAASREHAGPA